MHVAPPFDQATIPFVGAIHRALVYFGYDGDTVFPVVDLAFGAHFSNPEKGLRLVGAEGQPFNSPEMNSTNDIDRMLARMARDRVREFTDGKFVYVESFKPATDDKYGRWLLAVYVPAPRDPSPSTWARTVTVSPYSIVCFDLASQLVAENLGKWEL
jgi:hypothetical protein